MHLILTILIIHIMFSCDQNISLIFYVKMDSMSDCDIRLVFTFPPKDSTLQYKKCVLHWNNFPCISTLDKIQHLYISIFSLPLIRQTKSFLFCLSHGKLTVLFCLWHGKLKVFIFPLSRQTNCFILPLTRQTNCFILPLTRQTKCFVFWQPWVLEFWTIWNKYYIL